MFGREVEYGLIGVFDFRPGKAAIDDLRSNAVFGSRHFVFRKLFLGKDTVERRKKFIDIREPGPKTLRGDRRITV